MIKQEIHLENVFSRNLKCFKNRPLNIWEFVEESIKLHSKKTCIIYENKNYSYSQILKLVNSLETLFLKYSFKKKDRIGILFENNINFVIVSLYCIKNFNAAGINMAQEKFILKPNNVAEIKISGKINFFSLSVKPGKIKQIICDKIIGTQTNKPV